MKFSLIALTALFLAGSQAQAFMTVQETAEISPMGKYKIGLEPQIKLSNGSGFNFSGFFDAALNEEMSVRAGGGFGDVDFQATGSFKWVPIPDYENQPAVGGKASVSTWRDAGSNNVTFRIEPIVSKKFDTDQGLFTPYAALPVMFNTFSDKNFSNTTGIQVAGGTEYHHPDWGNTVIAGEIGLNAKDSFSYISGYVTFYLDDIKMRGSKH